MSEITTVRIHKRTKAELDEFKVHPRESYEEVLERLMDEAKKSRRGEDPREIALNAFTEEIKKKHGEKIDRIILYGSYARGEQTSESDVDVLIIWNGELTRGRRIAAELATKALINHGILISPRVLSPENYEEMLDMKVLFMKNIQREGVKIG